MEISLARHSRFQTRDLDHARQHMTGLFRCRFDLLDYSNFRLSINTATLEFMMVSVFTSTGGMRSNTHRDPDSYLLPRIEAGAWDYQYNGERLLAQPGQGILAVPDADNQSQMIGAFRSTSLHIPARLIEGMAADLMGEPVRRPLEIMGPIDMRGNHMGQRIDYLLEQLDSPNGIFDKYPLLGRNFQRGFIRVLIEDTHNNYQQLLGRNFGGSARRHVALMEEYFEAHLLEANVASAARALNLNARTLRESCRRLDRQTPEQILRTLRLHAAHRRMENPKPGDSRESIAREFGFTNVWRFTQYYQKIFHGETPKETLERGLRRIGVGPVEAQGAQG